LELTPEVNAADVRRDERFKCFRGCIDYKKFSKDPKIAEQALFLWSWLSKYGLGLWYLGFTDQSAVSDMLFDDVEKNEKVRLAIENLANEEYEDYKAAQYEFEDIYGARASESSSKKEDPKVKAARKKLSSGLIALLTNIELAVELKKDEALLVDKINKVIGDITVIISSAMATARSGISRSENGKEDEKPSEIAG
jgi:hypothetical protein